LRGPSGRTRLEREHLAEAERHIALSDGTLLARSRSLTSWSAGHSTALALSVLDTFQSRRAARIARRDAIGKELSLPADF
jgi:hypothetical protein